MEEDIVNYFTNCHVSWDTLYFRGSDLLFNGLPTKNETSETIIYCPFPKIQNSLQL